MWALIQYNRCSYRKGNPGTEMDTEGRCYEGTGTTQLSTSQGGGPGTDPSLVAFRRNQPRRHLHIWLLASRTGNQCVLLFKPHGLWCLVSMTLTQQPRNTSDLVVGQAAEADWPAGVGAAPLHVTRGI